MTQYTNGAHPPESTHRIPANLDAERAVLGSCLIDPAAFDKVSGFLKPNAFYRERHAWLYEAMQALANRHEPLDFITVTDEMERQGRLEEAGGPAFITELITDIPTALYVEHYARIVERTATLRRLLAAAGKIAELAYEEGDDLNGVIDRAEQIVMGVSEGRQRQQIAPLSDIMPAVIDRIEESSQQQGLMGLPTGFALLDRTLGGLQKSDLIVLAGRPGMGKTGFSLSVALNAARLGNARVAIFSLEMSEEQLVNRLLSMETGIDSHRLRSGKIEDEEWPVLLEAANTLSNLNIFIDDTPAATVNEIRAKARRLHAEHGLDLILIDYMQLMSGAAGNDGRRGGNRTEEVSYISRSLKALARELNVPVLALAQLSRAVEGRADKRPTLSDIRESGSVEQDSDIVLFIYREDYYIEDTDRQNIADVIIAKHRHGATGTVSLYFRKELTQFRDIEFNRTELEY